MRIKAGIAMLLSSFLVAAGWVAYRLWQIGATDFIIGSLFVFLLFGGMALTMIGNSN